MDDPEAKQSELAAGPANGRLAVAATIGETDQTRCRPKSTAAVASASLTAAGQTTVRPAREDAPAEEECQKSACGSSVQQSPSSPLSRVAWAGPRGAAMAAGAAMSLMAIGLTGRHHGSP